MRLPRDKILQGSCCVFCVACVCCVSQLHCMHVLLQRILLSLFESRLMMIACMYKGGCRVTKYCKVVAVCLGWFVYVVCVTIALHACSSTENFVIALSTASASPRSRHYLRYDDQVPTLDPNFRPPSAGAFVNGTPTKEESAIALQPFPCCSWHEATDKASARRLSPPSMRTTTTRRSANRATARINMNFGITLGT